jgi:hypothetical protein
MTLTSKTLVKAVFAIILAGVAVKLITSQVSNFRKSGEEGAMSWFYDESEKRLYQASRDTIPPDKGIGGPSGDGVRAVVIAFGASQKDPAKLKIAYLETHTAALKTLLDRVRSARLALRPFDGQIPSRTSSYFQDNTLVRRESDKEWYPTSGDEGRKIVSEWRGWRGPEGQRPIVCVP